MRKWVCRASEIAGIFCFHLKGIFQRFLLTLSRHTRWNKKNTLNVFKKKILCSSFFFLLFCFEGTYFISTWKWIYQNTKIQSMQTFYTNVSPPQRVFFPLICLISARFGRSVVFFIFFFPKSYCFHAFHFIHLLLLAFISKSKWRKYCETRKLPAIFVIDVYVKTFCNLRAIIRDDNDNLIARAKGCTVATTSATMTAVVVVLGDGVELLAETSEN